MTTPDKPSLPSLESLQERIDTIKEATEPKSGVHASHGDLSQAMRISIDLVAGVAMGLVCGYFLDNWIGSTPWFMVAGLFLGMAAGFRNMVRNVAEMNKRLSESTTTHDTQDERRP
jgi:ATP synthase protein I